jgi:hypothetical protein
MDLPTYLAPSASSPSRVLLVSNLSLRHGAHTGGSSSNGVKRLSTKRLSTKRGLPSRFPRPLKKLATKVARKLRPGAVDLDLSGEPEPPPIDPITRDNLIPPPEVIDLIAIDDTADDASMATSSKRVRSSSDTATQLVKSSKRIAVQSASAKPSAKLAPVFEIFHHVRPESPPPDDTDSASAAITSTAAAASSASLTSTSSSSSHPRCVLTASTECADGGFVCDRCEGEFTADEAEDFHYTCADHDLVCGPCAEWMFHNDDLELFCNSVRVRQQQARGDCETSPV